MIISTTGTLSQDDNFLVYHGPYAEIIPQMAEDGYQGVEMHIFDSAEIDRQELWSLLKKYNIRLTSIGTGSVYGRLHYSLGAAHPASGTAYGDSSSGSGTGDFRTGGGTVFRLP